MKLYGGRKADYRRAVVRGVEDMILTAMALLVFVGMCGLGEVLCRLAGAG